MSRTEPTPGEQLVMALVAFTTCGVLIVAYMALIIAVMV